MLEGIVAVLGRLWVIAFGVVIPLSAYLIHKYTLKGFNELKKATMRLDTMNEAL